MKTRPAYNANKSRIMSRDLRDTALASENVQPKKCGGDLLGPYSVAVFTPTIAQLLCQGRDAERQDRQDCKARDEHFERLRAESRCLTQNADVKSLRYVIKKRRPCCI